MKIARNHSVYGKGRAVGEHSVGRGKGELEENIMRQCGQLPENGSGEQLKSCQKNFVDIKNIV